MSSSVAVLRLAEDASGESHFDAFQIEQSLTGLCSAGKPFLCIRGRERLAGCVTIRSGSVGLAKRTASPHRPDPCSALAGELKVTASDGSVRMIGAGKAWLMSDTRGKGHKSEVASTVPFEAVVVLL